MNFDSFLANIIANIIATLIGGVALTFLFFLAREKLFPIPNVTGKWYLETTTRNTVYIPYNGMVLGYVIMIWSEGNKIKGTAEKIYENSSTGEQTFTGKNRTRATIEGYIEKKYLSEDKIYLHTVENGHERESTNFYNLLCKSDLEMRGTFNSMVADQDGTAVCRRKEF
jgi:hypothetical protein